jgi:hypothetical protein
MNVSHTSKIGKHAAVAWTMVSLLSASGLVMAQGGGGQPAVQVTGEKASVMPKSNATDDTLKAASATAPAAQTDPTFGNGPAPGPRANPGPGCNLFPAPASTGTEVPITYFGPPHLPPIPVWWVRTNSCNRAQSIQLRVPSRCRFIKAI